MTDAEVAALRADWRARWVAAGWPLATDPVSADHVIAVDRICRDRLEYLRDDPSRDTWRSMLAYIVDCAPGASRWYGDCDDWGSTVLDALDLTGVPADRLFRCKVSMQRDGVADHYAGMVEVGPSRERWIVGDTERGGAYPAGQRSFDFIEVKRVSDGLEGGFTPPAVTGA